MSITELAHDQGAAVVPILGRPPQVNLLPPEVRSARGLRVLQRWLVIALVVVVALCGAMLGYAALQRDDAQDELAREQQRTADLQLQIAQYAELPQVESALNRAWTAREMGMATDVLWSERIGAIAALLPNDMKIEGFVVDQPSVIDPEVANGNALRLAPTGAVSLTLRSTVLPDTAALMETLEAMPGFVSPWFSTAEVAEEDGAVFYRVNLSVFVTLDAYSNRYLRPDAAGTTEGSDG